MKDKGIRHLKRHHLISLSLIIFFLSLESVFTFNTRRPSPLFSLSYNISSSFNFHRTQLKQMKELEQEKDSLLAGLEVVERARDWYQGQIHNVTERQRQVGQTSHCTVSSDTDLIES